MTKKGYIIFSDDLPKKEIEAIKQMNTAFKMETRDKRMEIKGVGIMDDCIGEREDIRRMINAIKHKCDLIEPLLEYNWLEDKNMAARVCYLLRVIGVHYQAALRDADFIYKAAIPCGKTDTCNENEELN
jgi:hypothetical protein